MTVVPAQKRRRVSPPDLSGDESSPYTLISQPDGLGPDDFFTRAAGWNLEQEYEQRPRKQKQKDKENTRLPIKTAEGRVEPLQVTEVNGDAQDSWLSPGEEDNGGHNAPVVVQEEAPKTPIKQQIIEVKEELARVACLINEDPEEHISGLKTLAQISASKNPTIKKLALATELAVFKDVIPGYRIRPIAEADQTEKVSKQVRRLRAFEQTLVASYQNYLKDLASCAKSTGGAVPETSASIASVAISCACALLLAVPHFNFRGELLKILVAKLSGRKVDSDFNKCRETIEMLFHNDEDGTSSLDAVKMLTDMIKARGSRTDESVLNTFLHLRLLSEFFSKGSQNHIDKPTKEGGKKPKFKKEFRTKKQRKLLKERKVVAKEFNEADAIASHEERDRMQAETLKLVFVTYFRILKARSPHLMGAVLEGLAKYAHLINQDFFGDLLEALKDLIADADALANSDDPESSDQEQDPETTPVRIRDTTRESLLCITTAFALLEGQDASRAASSLHLDLTFFTTHLYKTLHALCMHPDLELSSKSLRLADPHGPSSPTTSTAPPPVPKDQKVNHTTTTVLLLRALSQILTPRPTPPLRLAAFTKQLSTCALQLPEKSALATLSLLQQVTKTHGRKIAALWNTEERREDGVFEPLRGVLEGSNPFASTVWEGELLRLHYCPGVREGLKGVERSIDAVR